MNFNQVLSDATLAQWVGSIGTVVGIFTGIVGIWWQFRKQWLLSSASVVNSLSLEFNNETWRKHRKNSAVELNKHFNGENISLSRDIAVLGFFENIGYLVRRGAIDKEMIWNKFGWYIVRYYIALTYKIDLIESARRKEADSTLWKETQYLYFEMIKVYSQNGVKIITDSELLVEQNKKIRIEELLEQELNLC